MIKFFLYAFLLLGFSPLFSQDARQQLIDDAAIEYFQNAGNQATIFYGKQQEGIPRTTNHSYLVDEQHVKARLSYHNVIYPEAMLRLDLYRNEMIVQSPELRSFVLFPEHFDYAELHGYHIIYFQRDSLPGCPSTGYYILLHSENYKVFKRQRAILMHDSKLNTISNYYTFTTNYFLFKDDEYHTIRNKRGLLNALHPYKKELKQFISSHKWRFKRDADILIAHTIKEYEKLTGLR